MTGHSLVASGSGTTHLRLMDGTDYVVQLHYSAKVNKWGATVQRMKDGTVRQYVADTASALLDGDVAGFIGGYDD